MRFRHRRVDEHVGDRGLLEMLLQVVESVLGDVTDSESGVLLDLTLLRDGLTGKELDEGRLSGSVGSEDTDSGGESERARDVVKLGSDGSGVGEGAMGELHDGSSVRSDSHQRTRRRESEPERGTWRRRSGLEIVRGSSKGRRLRLT
jgi:hypothetical protein